MRLEYAQNAIMNLHNKGTKSISPYFFILPLSSLFFLKGFSSPSLPEDSRAFLRFFFILSSPSSLNFFFCEENNTEANNLQIRSNIKNI